VNSTSHDGASEGGRWHLIVHLLTSGEHIRAGRKVAALSVRAVGGSDEDAAAVEVAVGEILTNARLHAYGGAEGPVTLRIDVTGQAVWIAIHDKGRPITDAPAVPTTRPERGTGGRGLYVVGRLMDETTIVSDADGRGLRVELRKRLTSAG
jgi:anti-sigma regulatory factor (Ser/Thr protein kinase)